MGDNNVRSEIQCRQILSKMKALEALEPSVKSRILNRISKKTLEAIDQAKDSEWLPIEYSIELCESVDTEIGEDGVIKWSKEAVGHSIKASVIGPFFLAALNMLKFRPTLVIKLSPKLWKSVCRNCGELSTSEASSGCIHVELNGLPLEIVSSRPYLIHMVAFIQALGDISSASDSKASLVRSSEANRSATISLSWGNPK